MSYEPRRDDICDYGYCDRYLQPMAAYKPARRSWLTRLTETWRLRRRGTRAEGIDGESRPRKAGF